MTFICAPLFVHLLTLVVFDSFSDVFAKEINHKSTHHPHLVPKFLNGNYITWPATYPCIPVDRFSDTPPPEIYYKPDNVVFTRMQMAGDRAFVITPRYKPGVPFTLGYVPLTKYECDSKNNCKKNGFQSISPYPSLSAHCQFSKQLTRSTSKNWYCDKPGLVNVVDLYLGPDGILWVLDIGIVHTSMSDDKRTKPYKYTDPRVLGIDVVTGKTVHNIPLEKLMKPVRNETMATMAQSLHAMTVEYADKCVNMWRKCEAKPSAFYAESSVRDSHRKCGHRRSRGQRTEPKPVAVYVSDGYSGGSILVWLVNDYRGFRVVLPESITHVTGDGNLDECYDCDPDLTTGGTTIHMALLGGTSGPTRYLYFTYSLKPDAYRIPVLAMRNRRRPVVESVVSDVQLASCKPTGGGNRCVTNVGRKPVGSDGRRPMVPVNAAEELLWYYRDSAAGRGSDLYVWDSRESFLPDNFEPVGQKSRGTDADAPDSVNACSCNEDDEPRSVNENCDENRDDGDADGDTCRVCAKAREAKRSGRSPGSMEITSVDFAYTDLEVINHGGQDQLWAMQANVDDWKNGRTGHFGMTALLYPIAVKKIDSCC